ncbi:hypothetical protein [Saccharicrinis aurantiacus]|uniref:hypothetical protein n=1 Tax=Saccharicrinis aurantiacus TaxID=1849719 RepID=UPI002491D2BD|nr:hypothetical protein [Saccharicrinis aurantiacus]
MKTIRILFTALLTIYISISCSKQEGIIDEPIIRTGVVLFGTKPYYENDTLYFAVKVLLKSEEDVINVGYELKEDDQVIENSNTQVVRQGNTPDDVLESMVIKTHLPKAKYEGSKITVILDPINFIKMEDNLAIQKEESWKTYIIEIKKAD